MCHCMVAIRWWKPTATIEHSVQCLANQARMRAEDPFASPAIYREGEQPTVSLGRGWRAWDGSLAWFQSPR